MLSPSNTTAVAVSRILRTECAALWSTRPLGSPPNCPDKGLPAHGRGACAHFTLDSAHGFTVAALLTPLPPCQDKSDRVWRALHLQRRQPFGVLFVLGRSAWTHGIHTRSAVSRRRQLESRLCPALESSAAPRPNPWYPAAAVGIRHRDCSCKPWRRLCPVLESPAAPQLLTATIPMENPYCSCKLASYGPSAAPQPLTAATIPMENPYCSCKPWPHTAAGPRPRSAWPSVRRRPPPSPAPPPAPPRPPAELQSTG